MVFPFNTFKKDHVLRVAMETQRHHERVKKERERKRTQRNSVTQAVNVPETSVKDILPGAELEK